MSPALLLALAAVLAWAVLLGLRGRWWRTDVNDEDAAELPDPADWPAVAAIVPARDEAPTIGATVRSLLAQDYPGPFRLVVVDDRSTDGTGDLARAAAVGDPRLIVVTGRARPPGWTGKLWAQQQGLEALAATPGAVAAGDPLAATPSAVAAGDPPAADTGTAPEYLLLTDADIRHDRDSLRALVRRARAEGLAMVSLMARLRCENAAERALIPFFVLFFGMLYPFRWVNDPAARTAGAAGGCVLLRRDALEASGGLEPMRGAIIDDCTLARRIKHPQGSAERARGSAERARGAEGRPASGESRPIWLGLTRRVVSLRPYEGLGELRRMVARTAYAQLGYNPFLLLGTVLGLGLVFLAPPLLAIFAEGTPRWLGVAAWLAMVKVSTPILLFYGLSPWRGAALPAVAALYLLFTLDSAWAEWRGRGGLWKGEAHRRDAPAALLPGTAPATAAPEGGAAVTAEGEHGGTAPPRLREPGKVA
ncbi:glycosyltransferase [Roseomonas sp. BN140053]|uniref:glycosyltransferase n=1 Tax=Roseomonas sp. BN140053 TaxID=3391898 RepID=UPI0039ECAF4F